MRIFVTGASGFVGGAATRRLVDDGHEVRAMSRSEASDHVIVALGAEPVRCDLENIAASHVGNSEAVVHCAAYVEQWGPADAWRRFNVDGTRNVLAAARSAGVKRFVHISTESVLWRGQHLRGVDETYPRAPDSPYPYAATKAQAELLVEQASSPEFATITLRPRFVWGPGDTTLMPVLEQIARQGKFMWIDGGRARTSTTHIDNLVQAIVLSLTRGRSGEAYFVLDDGVRTMREMLSGLAATRGIALADRSAPAWFAEALGAVFETFWRALPMPGAPPLTRFSAMIMSREAVLTGDKARAELGYRPVISVEEGLRALASSPP
jgi:nucleoside-diphosphate-sugar epimerase